MGSVSDWLLWVVGGIAALTGLATAFWALLFDRSRGRRRCPKCWYDLSGTAAGSKADVACPECGRVVVSAHEVGRTRRRWKFALFGLALMVVGVSLSVLPWINSGRWKTRGPTTLLVLALPFCDDMALGQELIRRSHPENYYITAASQNRMWGWQRWLLARTAPAAAEHESLSVRTRSYALCLVSNLDLDPKPSVETMLRWMGSGNPKMVWQGMLELKCALHRLGPDLDRCLTALQAHTGNSDERTRWDVSATALFGSQARGRGPWPSYSLPALDQDPSHYVERLRGKFRGDLLDVYGPLGLSVQFFTRPFGGDPGPFKVDRYDLDLDGDGRADCLLRIGDHDGYYWNFLVFLRLNESWVLVDCLSAASGDTHPPDSRCVDVGSAGNFLVVRTNAGTGDGYELRTDSWFKVGPSGCRPALSAWAEGHTDALWKGMNGLAVGGAVELQTSIRTVETDGRAGVAYEIDARYSDTSAGGEQAGPERPSGIGWRPATPIAVGKGRVSLRGSVRYNWKPSEHRFVVDPLSDWTPEQVLGVCTDGPSEFLDHHSARLVTMASELDGRTREWLRAIISFRGDTPAGRALESAINRGESDPGSRQPKPD